MFYEVHARIKGLNLGMVSLNTMGWEWALSQKDQTFNSNLVYIERLCPKMEELEDEVDELRCCFY